jgi:hypothetical protein
MALSSFIYKNGSLSNNSLPYSRRCVRSVMFHVQRAAKSSDVGFCPWGESKADFVHITLERRSKNPISRSYSASLHVISFTPRPLYSWEKSPRFPLDWRMAVPKNTYASKVRSHILKGNSIKYPWFFVTLQVSVLLVTSVFVTSHHTNFTRHQVYS